MEGSLKAMVGSQNPLITLSVTQEFLPLPFTIRYGRYGILVTALWSKLASFVTYNMKGKMYVFEIEIRIYVLKKISF